MLSQTSGRMSRTLFVAGPLLLLGFIAGCPMDGSPLDIQTPLDFANPNVNVTVNDGDVNVSSGGANDGSADGEDAQRDEPIGDGDVVVDPRADDRTIEILTPADGDVLSVNERNFHLSWVTTGLSSPRFGVFLHNADGSRFKEYTDRGNAIGNGEYEAGWTPNARGRISPGEYIFEIRDRVSGTKAVVRVEFQ